MQPRFGDVACDDVPGADHQDQGRLERLAARLAPAFSQASGPAAAVDEPEDRRAVGVMSYDPRYGKPAYHRPVRKPDRDVRDISPDCCSGRSATTGFLPAGPVGCRRAAALLPS
jgi:hypothetical protein